MGERENLLSPSQGDIDLTLKADEVVRDVAAQNYVCEMPKKHLIGMIAGPLLFIIASSIPFSEEYPHAPKMLGCTFWISSWWLTEAAPLGVTALLPVVLFPVLEILEISVVTKAYFSTVSFLLIGALMVNIAIEHVSLHVRFALWILLHTNPSPRGMLFGFMLSCWSLSSMCFNTSTCLMMIPLVGGIIERAKNRARHSPAALRSLTEYHKACLIGVAWSTTIGGIATLIGTAINALAAGVFLEQYPNTDTPVNFANWLMFGLPLSASLLVPAWWILCKFFLGKPSNEDTSLSQLPSTPLRNPGSQFPNSPTLSTPLRNSPSQLPTSPTSPDLPGSPSDSSGWFFDREILLNEARGLGPLTRDEKAVAGVQILLMIMWVLRPLAIEPFVGTCQDPTFTNSFDCPSGQWNSPLKNYDGGLACGAAIILYLIPSKTRVGEKILNWEVVNQKFPWELLLIFGSGFALAEGFKGSGLSTLIADEFGSLKILSPGVLTGLVCISVSFLTEITTAIGFGTIFIPIVAAASAGLEMHPLILVLSVTACCSTAFMLPLATPPNLLVYKTGYIGFWTMVKPGFFMNIIGALATTFWVFFTAPVAFEGKPFDWPFPQWIANATGDP